jgi:hypothetical protein
MPHGIFALPAAPSPAAKAAPARAAAACQSGVRHSAAGTCRTGWAGTNGHQTTISYGPTDR